MTAVVIELFALGKPKLVCPSRGVEYGIHIQRSAYIVGSDSSVTHDRNVYLGRLLHADIADTYARYRSTAVLRYQEKKSQKKLKVIDGSIAIIITRTLK